MTANQIAYQAMLENSRHNRVAEGETGRHNLVTEQQARDELTERERYQQAVNNTALLNYHETVRSNKAKEAENTRHNVATEAENIRHNREAESVAHRGNDINLSSIQARWAELGETSRSNRVKESISQATLSETRRTNLANEAIRRQSNYVQQSYNDGYLANMSTLVPAQVASNYGNAYAAFQKGSVDDVLSDVYPEYYSTLNTLNTSSADLNNAKIVTEGTTQSLNKAKKRVAGTEAYRNITQGNKNITGSMAEMNDLISTWIKP